MRYKQKVLVETELSVKLESTVIINILECVGAFYLLKDTVIDWGDISSINSSV